MNISNKLKKAIIFTYIILSAIVSVYGLFAKQNNNSYDEGYLIYLPMRGQIAGNELTISGAVYAKEGIDEAYLELTGDNFSQVYPIEFQQVIHKGEVLETLATFRIEETLQDGIYTAKIYADTTIGRNLEFENYQITVDGNSSLKPFEMFGRIHLITMLIMLLLGIFIIVLFKKRPIAQEIIRYLIIFTMIASDIYIRIWLINNNIFKASYDMNLHMCDIGAIILAAMMLTNNQKRKQNMYDMLFIWGIGGALMAILTPEMNGFGFPSFYYFNFFIKHFVIILGVYAVTFFDGLRPNIKSLPRVLIISTVLVGLLYGVDQLVRLVPPYEVGNYMFIGYPPLGGSAIDLFVDIFGPSPWYYMGMLITGVIVYVILYVPFMIEKTVKKRKFNQSSAE